MPGHIADVIAPPASDGVTQGADSANAPAREYFLELDRYLSIVTGEGDRLAELGRARSRNVVELGVRMDRFREASTQLLAFISTSPPPPALELFVAELTTELAVAETAIQASITAIRGFNWDTLGTSVDAFSRSIEAIEALRGRGVD